MGYSGPPSGGGYGRGQNQGQSQSQGQGQGQQPPSNQQWSQASPAQSFNNSNNHGFPGYQG